MRQAKGGDTRAPTQVEATMLALTAFRWQYILPAEDSWWPTAPIESVDSRSAKLLMLLHALLRWHTESANEDVVLSLGGNEASEGNGDAAFVEIDHRLVDLLHSTSLTFSATKPKVQIGDVLAVALALA